MERMCANCSNNFSEYKCNRCEDYDHHKFCEEAMQARIDELEKRLKHSKDSRMPLLNRVDQLRKDITWQKGLEKELQTKLEKANTRIKELEDFIAEFRSVSHASAFEILEQVIRVDSKQRKLWCDIHLKKYPENY